MYVCMYEWEQGAVNLQHVDYIVVFGVGVMMWKILPTHYRKGKLDGSLWMIMLGLVLLASASRAPLCIFFYWDNYYTSHHVYLPLSDI